MILDNISRIQRRIGDAAARSGREPSSVRIMAVTKYAESGAILEALQSGEIRHLGESRIQDTGRKRQQAELEKWPAASWHMIGHLQTNKIAKMIEFFDSLDSLDSLRLAEALEGRLAETERVLPILVEAKLSAKESQSGLPPEQVEEFIRKIKDFRHLRVQGLMAIAPMTDPVESVRPYFQRLKRLSDQILNQMPEEIRSQWTLSMGMSRDFEIAVEEGSNMVRLGSSLFNTSRSNAVSVPSREV